MPFTKPKAAQIDFDITNITDPLIRLNSGESGSADKDVGIVIERGSDTNVALIFDESANEFVAINTSETGTTSGNVSISSYAPLQVSTFKSSGATMTGAIAMGTNKITGLGDPGANQDAATKAYVDSTVAGFGSLSNIVEDTTPQLGGNLDVNTKNINFGDSASSSDDRLNFGAGTDLSIYHDGSDNTIITNSDLNINASGEVVVSGDSQFETKNFVVSGSRTGTGGAVSRVIWRNRAGSTNINANSAETRIEGWRINGSTPSLIFNFGGTERHRFDDDGKIALGAVPGSIGSITETVEITGTLSTTSTAKLSSIELGGTTDTTLARSSAGVVTIEGVEITTNTASQTLTNKTLTSPTINAFSGTGNGSITGTLSIDNTTTGDSLLIETTEASSSAGPVITLKRHSGSPADADYLGRINFKGENDADQGVTYARISGKILDASDGTEDGIIEFANVKAGSNTITARLRSDSLQLLNSTGLTVAGTTTLSGNLALNAQADLQFYDSDSSHYVGFQAPATISSSILWTLPNTDGTDGQIIKTDGAGTLSWTDNSGGGGSGSSFPNSTFTTCPASDGSDFDLSFNVAQTAQETPFEASGTDAFGVNLGSVFSLMDPVGQTDGPFDMGALT